MTKTSKNRHHVVIIGAGFGGIEVANQLAGVEVDVTIIDRRNHHLFQPLLYQVAGASLSTSEIAWPIRYGNADLFGSAVIADVAEDV